jgi:sensor histidine kinase YesM
LSLYLSLEKLRFGEDFQYEISLSNDIDANATYLPPLLLQPFVENAIKHGLLHKKGEKSLSISFSIIDEMLISTIVDNGIGRKHAQEIKNRQKESTASFSTNATLKRIDLLNNVEGKSLKIEIIDLYENNLPSGTKVMLKTPF